MPSAFSVETFARGLVELIGFQTEEGDSLVGKSLIDYNRENPNSILMCAAKRGEEVIVPNGSFVPQTGDPIEFAPIVVSAVLGVAILAVALVVSKRGKRS